MIAEEIGSVAENCKRSYYASLAKLKDRDQESKVHQLLQQQHQFDHCLVNLDNICRFCCKISDKQVALNIVYDESDNELLQKINYTLYDNVSRLNARENINLNLISF